MSIRLLILTLALYRVDDIFPVVETILNLFALVRSCSRFDSFALPNSDAFAVIDYKNGVYLSMHETRSA